MKPLRRRGAGAVGLAGALAVGLGTGTAGAVDPGLDCTRIAKKLAWERSYVHDLQPGPPADQDGSVRGEAPEEAEQQDDRLKERHQMRRIARLQALARQKGCPG